MEAKTCALPAALEHSLVQGPTSALYVSQGPIPEKLQPTALNVPQGPTLERARPHAVDANLGISLRQKEPTTALIVKWGPILEKLLPAARNASQEHTLQKAGKHAIHAVLGRSLEQEPLHALYVSKGPLLEQGLRSVYVFQGHMEVKALTAAHLVKKEPILQQLPQAAAFALLGLILQQLEPTAAPSVCRGNIHNKAAHRALDARLGLFLVQWPRTVLRVNQGHIQEKVTRHASAAQLDLFLAQVPPAALRA
jgi:hypothetical protein